MLAGDENGVISEAAEWNWEGRPIAPDANDGPRWRELEKNPLILDIDALRHGSTGGGSVLPLPEWLANDETAWAGVPLVGPPAIIIVVASAIVR